MFNYQLISKKYKIYISEGYIYVYSNPQDISLQFADVMSR